MPYLSRLIMDTRSPRVLSDLASPYEMHRTIMGAFPDLVPGERVLFRLDTYEPTARPLLLVQSPRLATWEALEAGSAYLYRPAEGEPPNPLQKPFTMALRQGEALAFRLRANPTFRRGRRRLAWLHSDQQSDWLRGQGLRAGFTLDALVITREGHVWARKRLGGRSLSLCFQSVLFSGVLRVTCPDRLARVVEEGLGSGKAFGFGLLSLAPPV